MDVLRLKFEIKKNGYTIETFCKKCGFSKKLLYRRFSNPSSFTYKEMMIISNVLGYENPNELFFEIKVS